MTTFSLKSKVSASLLIAILLGGFSSPVASHAIPPQIAISNVVSSADGFTFLISNYDPQYVYTISGPASGTVLDHVTGVVTVSGLMPGESATAFIQAWGDGEGVGNNVTGQALEAAYVPTFGAPERVTGGFTAQITSNSDGFSLTAETTAGNVTIDQLSRVVVTGLTAGQSATVTVTSARAGYANGTATVSSSAAAAVSVPAPILAAPVSTADGFTVRVISAIPSGYTLSADFMPGTAPVGGNTEFPNPTTFVVSGLNPGQQASIVFVTQSETTNAVSPEVVVVGSALPALPAPLYPSAFAQSATSAFVTWGSVDGATGYRVTASNGGGTCTNTINYCTITGLTAGQNYTFSIVALRDAQVGPAAVTAGVLMESALDVSGSLSSSTWKVGAVVTANPLIFGQHSVVRYEWYRCNTAVAVSDAAPACEVISGADGAAYTLKAADLGKYVTAHLRVTGGVGQVGATIANSRPVLSATAIGGALVDPDGKPLIAEIPTRQISIVGGTTITINGTGFTGVTSVLVNGVAATVISATDTTLVISVPASTQVGLVDVAVTTPKGTVTEASALAYVAKQTSISSKSKTLTKFAGKATKLTAKQKAEIKAFVKANSTLPKLVCSASTVGVKKSAAETKATLARAKAACSYAASVSTNVFTATKAAHGKTTGKISKVVTLTISN